LRVIIIGAGKVGFSIAEMLTTENHDVVVIEKDEDRERIVQEHIDVQTINGSGANIRVLEEAGVREADLVIAVTEMDELNMVACLLAKQYGVPKTVARVRNPEYVEVGDRSPGPSIGIDLVINPERVTAMEIAKLIEVPEAIDVEYYADGQVQLLELRIDKHAPVIDKKLKDLDFTYPSLIIAILRDGEIIIPRGDDYVLANDVVFIVGKTVDMTEIEKFLGKERMYPKSIVILGGGRIGYYLAKQLEGKDLSVKIIDKNLAKCKNVAKGLEDALVLNGDGTDIDFLQEEGIGETDLFVAVTGDDKLNLLVSLLAKELGAKKTIAQIRRFEYIPLVEKVGVDTTVSPRMLTAGAIYKFIRKGQIVSVNVLVGAKAEAMELIVPEDSRVAHKMLKDLKFPKGAILGAIQRAGEVIIPTGLDTIEPGDKVMVFSIPKAIVKVEEFFNRGR